MYRARLTNNTLDAQFKYFFLNQCSVKLLIAINAQPIITSNGL